MDLCNWVERKGAAVSGTSLSGAARTELAVSVAVCLAAQTMAATNWSNRGAGDEKTTQTRLVCRADIGAAGYANEIIGQRIRAYEDERARGVTGGVTLTS